MPASVLPLRNSRRGSMRSTGWRIMRQALNSEFSMSVQFFQFESRPQALAAVAQALLLPLQAALRGQGRAQVLLPGGSTPQQLLPLLAALPVDWSRVLASPTDERWVAADAADSNLQLLREGLPAARWLDPRQGSEARAAARQWGDRLGDWLPFSAVLLGMGEDGHFASLFPGMPGLASALDVEQPAGCVVGRAPVEPQLRLSLNLPMLLSTRWLGLLAFGARKAELIEQVLADLPETRTLPLHALLHQQRVPPGIYWAP